MPSLGQMATLMIAIGATTQKAGRPLLSFLGFILFATQVAHGQSTPEIYAAHCGHTYTSLSEDLGFTSVPGATQYEIQFIDSATMDTSYATQATAGDPPINYLMGSSQAVLNFNSTYYVSARALVSGNWGEFGDSCKIYMGDAPLSQLRPDLHDTTFHSFGEQIRVANVYGGGIKYELEFTDLSTNAVTTGIITQDNRPLYYVSPPSVADLHWGRSYSVRVRVGLNDSWGQFGDTAYFSMAMPVVQLSQGYEDTTLQDFNGRLYVDNITGAEEYGLRITDLNRDTVTYATWSQRYSALYVFEDEADLHINSNYSVQFRVKLEGAWGAYGDTFHFNTGSPLVHLLPAYEDTTCQDFNSRLYVEAIGGAEEYGLRITDLNTDTVTYATWGMPYAALYAFANEADLHINSNYSVQFKVKLNGAWSEYGETFHFNTGSPLVQLDPAYEDTTCQDFNSRLYVEAIGGAEEYGLRITDLITDTVTFATWGQANATLASFKTAANLRVNSSYSVQFRVRLNGDWSQYGDTFHFNIAAPTTELLEVYRDSTYGDFSQSIAWQTVPGANDYGFRFIDVTAGGNQDTVDYFTFSAAVGSYSLGWFAQPNTANLHANRSYQVHVAAKIGSEFMPFGPGHVIHTGAPTTELLEPYRDSTFADFSQSIAWQTVPGANDYGFRFIDVTPGGNQDTVDYFTFSAAVGSFALSWFAQSNTANLQANRSYQVHVAAKIGSEFMPFGPGHVIHTGAPTTELLEPYRDSTFADFSQSIAWQTVPGANDYGFRFIDVTPGGNQDTVDYFTFSAAVGSYALSWFAQSNTANLQANRSYKVHVAAKIGSEFMPFGPGHVIHTAAPTTELLEAYRDSTYADFSQSIAWQTVPGANDYGFRFIDVTPGGNQDTVDYFTFSAAVGSFALSWFAKPHTANLHANRSYQVHVAAKIGSEFMPFGAGHVIHMGTPVAELELAYRDSTYYGFATSISWTPISGAMDYAFRFVDITPGAVQDTTDVFNFASNLTSHQLSWFAQQSTAALELGHSYKVHVAAKIGSEFTPFGPGHAMHIEYPLPEILDDYRDSTFSDFTKIIAWTPIVDATDYAFRFIDITPGSALDTVNAFIYGSSNSSNPLNWFAHPSKGNISANHSYLMHVAAKIGTEYKPFGPGHPIHIGNPTSTLTLTSCDSTFENFSEIMAWDPMAGATEYGFQFIDVTTPPDGPEDTASFFNYGSTSASQALKWFANPAKGNLSANHSYDVRINGSFGGEFSEFGDACTIHIGDPTTELIDAQHGVQFEDFDQNLTWNELSGTQEYAMRFIDQETGDTTAVMTYNSTSYSNPLRWWATRRELSAATAYQVEFAARFGSEFGSWGEPQIFTTGDPTTQLDSTFCGANVQISDEVSWEELGGRYGHRFEFTNLHTGEVFINEYLTTIAYGSVSSIGGSSLIDNQSYEVRISVMFGHKWGSWGPACRLDVGDNIPALPMLDAVSSGKTFNDFTDVLSWEPITGAEMYKIQFTNVDSTHPDYLNVTSGEVTGSNSNFALWYFTHEANGAVTSNTMYDVDVAVKIGGVYDDFGPKRRIYTGDPTTTFVEPSYAFNDFSDSLEWNVIGQRGMKFMFVNTDVNHPDYQDTTYATIPGIHSGYRFNTFTHSIWGSLATNATYDAQISIKFGNHYGGFGPATSITTGDPVFSFDATSCDRQYDTFLEMFTWPLTDGPSSVQLRFINTDENHPDYQDTTYGVVSNVHTGWEMWNYATPSLGNITANTSYEASLAVKYGNHYGSFGPTCAFTTGDPTSGITDLNLCGDTVYTLADTLHFGPTPFHNHIKIRLVNDEPGSVAYEDTTYFEGSGIGWSRDDIPFWWMSHLIVPEAQYSISYANKFGNHWGSYGPECSVYFDEMRSALKPAYCNASIELTDSIYWEPIVGAQNYRLKFVNVLTGEVDSVEVGGTVTGGLLSGLGAGFIQDDQAYDVSVSVEIGGVFGEYGSECRVNVGEVSNQILYASDIEHKSEGCSSGFFQIDSAEYYGTTGTCLGTFGNIDKWFKIVASSNNIVIEVRKKEVSMIGLILRDSQSDLDVVSCELSELDQESVLLHFPSAVKGQSYYLQIISDSLYGPTNVKICTYEGGISLNTIVSPTTCEASNGNIVVNAVNGIEPYSYIWSDGSLGNLKSDVSSGQYLLTVSDVAGIEQQFRVFSGVQPEWRESEGIVSVLQGVKADHFGDATAIGNNFIQWGQHGELRFESSTAIASVPTYVGLHDLDGSAGEFGIYIKDNNVYTITEQDTVLRSVHDTIHTYSMTISGQLLFFRSDGITIGAAILPPGEWHPKVAFEQVVDTSEVLLHNLCISSCLRPFEPKLCVETSDLGSGYEIELSGDAVIEIVQDTTGGLMCGKLVEITSGNPKSFEIKLNGGVDFDAVYLTSEIDWFGIISPLKWVEVDSITGPEITETLIDYNTDFYSLDEYKVALMPTSQNAEEVHFHNSEVHPQLEQGLFLTPNGDGQFDELIIEGLENVDTYSLEIMDRNNHVVFYTENKEEAWNGSIGGLIPVIMDASYSYSIQYDNQVLTGQLIVRQ